MKRRYWSFQRKGIFQVEDSLTGKRESLRTRAKRQAERLRDTKNEAAQRGFTDRAHRQDLSRSSGSTYQRAHPAGGMDGFSRPGHGGAPFRMISRRELVETTTKDRWWSSNAEALSPITFFDASPISRWR